jgi:hypothetical protein
LLDGEPLPKMNSSDMTKRCGAMIGKLNDDVAVDSLFLKAVSIVDGVAGSWDRDSIRTEPVSKALFQKLDSTTQARWPGYSVGAQAPDTVDHSAGAFTAAAVSARHRVAQGRYFCGRLK